MREQFDKQRDLFLLVSLLFVVMMHPVLDHGTSRRLLLGFLTYVPLVLSTIKMSHRKRWIWPFVVMILGSAVCVVGNLVFPGTYLAVVQWILTAGAIGLSVVGLFSYLQKTRIVTNNQLYTAASIYLLLGLLWFSIYNGIAEISPDSFRQSSPMQARSRADLLYFSFATLTTLGYGDIIPVSGAVRMLAVLEAATGVLYVAITVAVLVSAYKPVNEQ